MWIYPQENLSTICNIELLILTTHFVITICPINFFAQSAWKSLDPLLYKSYMNSRVVLTWQILWFTSASSLTPPSFSVIEVINPGQIEILQIKISYRDYQNKINPLSPHDALKHHFTSLITDLIFLQLRVLERKFPWDWFTNTWQFSSIFHPHQIIFIHYKSRIADEDDYGKLRLERVKINILNNL